MPAIEHSYIHVPFCPTICPYCDFHVLTRASGLVEAYVQKIAQEAEFLAQHYHFQAKTMYFGGGTPSFLRDGEMVELVSAIQKNIGWGSQENTLEVNPGTVTPERAALWRSLGFDRVSVGVQSLHDPTLKFLGRKHSAKQAQNAIDILHHAGFRVSGDLITAVPQQNLQADIAALVALGVEHISAYTLTIEEGTEFYRKGITVTEADEYAGFHDTAKILAGYGFHRYELSNYAKAGAESLHNLAYWHNAFYAGLGPSASGHYPHNHALGERLTRPKLHTWLQASHTTGESYPITPEEYATDALFMGLRLHSGVNIRQLSHKVGMDVASHYHQALALNVEQGLMEVVGDTWKATEQGLWVLNTVISRFLQHDQDSG